MEPVVQEMIDTWPHLFSPCTLHACWLDSMCCCLKARCFLLHPHFVKGSCNNVFSYSRLQYLFLIVKPNSNTAPCPRPKNFNEGFLTFYTDLTSKFEGSRVRYRYMYSCCIVSLQTFHPYNMAIEKECGHGILIPCTEQHLETILLWV